MSKGGAASRVREHPPLEQGSIRLSTRHRRRAGASHSLCEVHQKKGGEQHLRHFAQAALKASGPWHPRRTWCSWLPRPGLALPPLARPALSEPRSQAAAAMNIILLAAAAGSFELLHDRFLLDGKPYIIASGSMHYWRVPRAYWADRLLRMRAMGLNSVQTYVPWSLHQPNASTTLDFMGHLDLEAFLLAADKARLKVLLRIGPYIDAEMDFGGIPPWLLSCKPPVRALRTNDTQFLAHSTRWWRDGVLP